MKIGKNQFRTKGYDTYFIKKTYLGSVSCNALSETELQTRMDDTETESG